MTNCSGEKNKNTSAGDGWVARMRAPDHRLRVPITKMKLAEIWWEERENRPFPPAPTTRGLETYSAASWRGAGGGLTRSAASCA